MNKHFDDYLCKKYPKIFADRRKPMTETCMCWGFECSSGWFHLIDRLCASIQWHLDNPQWVEQKDIRSRLKRLWNKTGWNWFIQPLVNKLPFKEYNRYTDIFTFDVPYVPGPPIHQVVATQVKEKFGGLRFYVSGGDEFCYNLISFAENLSHHICEECGAFDETVVTSGRGWVKSECSKCAKDKDFHKKAVDKEMVKLWDKVRKDESKRKTNSNVN